MLVYQRVRYGKRGLADLTHLTIQFFFVQILDVFVEKRHCLLFEKPEF